MLSHCDISREGDPAVLIPRTALPLHDAPPPHWSDRLQIPYLKNRCQGTHGCYRIAISQGRGTRLYLSRGPPFRFTTRLPRTGPIASNYPTLKAGAKGLMDAIALRYLKGGGPGCTYPEERPSASRRAYHALV